ncbi:MAG: hypothetical protein ACI9JM_003126 [Halioglobus sp.]|jgi:hypothetical protein
MRDVRLKFTKGPMASEVHHAELGSLVIGREPRETQAEQATLMLRGADSSVSRNHAALHDRDGKIILENISGNGTTVDGKLTVDDIELQPNTTIGIGSDHVFTIDWQVIRSQSVKSAQDKVNEPAIGSSGMLASPVVRAVIGLYLLGMIVVGVWFGMGGAGDTKINDDWPDLVAKYEKYNPAGLSDVEKTARKGQAQDMVIRLRVLRVNEQENDAKRLCREIMQLDADVNSPLYRYGARCLGSI